MRTAVGVPSTVAGSNLQVLTALVAFSSRPRPAGTKTHRSVKFPSRSTVPANLARSRVLRSRTAEEVSEPGQIGGNGGPRRELHRSVRLGSCRPGSGREGDERGKNLEVRAGHGGWYAHRSPHHSRS